MSKISQLIAKHCPKGVEFRELQEIFITRNGYTPSTANKSFWTNGTIPWFRMEDIRKNGQILGESIQKVSIHAVKGGKLFPANSIIMATTATIGEHALITVPHLSNQRFTSLVLREEFENRLDMRFIYYYCFILGKWCQHNTTTSSFASVDMAGFKRFKFPIPPLEIQREIVRILDKFTDLVTDLTKELALRQKQYAYYRDKLLTFPHDKVEWKALGEVFHMQAGQHISASKIKKDTDDIYPYPCLGGNGIRGFVKEYSHDGKYLLIGRQGALCGNIHRMKGKFYATEHAIVVTEKEGVNIDWAFHMLTFMNLNQYASKSAQPGLAVGKIQELKTPVPSFVEQERIVAILDKFDALVNDISEGLPAEIAARRQQYEYYRDKLLTFQEAA